MNYNRRRNIFTLGDFQHQHPHPQQQIKANRRQNSDPFERDPFKIQSYNFRYADRPSYPLQNLVNRVNSNSSVKRFETYYYNYDFAPTRHDKENPPTNKFHEFRRRKFLLEHQQQNPNSASLFSQTANSRQLGVRQQSAQQQQQQAHNQQLYAAGRTPFATITTTANGALLPQGNVSATADMRTPASATAAVAAAAAAGAAAATVAQQRAHQRQRGGGAGHTTDSSSAYTAIGSYSVGTSNVSSFKSSTAPLVRLGSSREYLSGVRPPHSSSAQAAQIYGAPHALGRSRSSSRSSLGKDGAADGGRLLGGKTAGSATAIVYKNVRDLSGPRASASEHARRAPLQTLQSSSKNLVTATVEQAKSSCSGCQININIKGLDPKQLGENVVIKIESDNSVSNLPSTNGKQKPNASLAPSQNNSTFYSGYGVDVENKQPLQPRKSGSRLRTNVNVELPTNNLTGGPTTSPNQTNMNIVQQGSSSTFIIDKRLSKFAMRERDSNKERARNAERKGGERQRSISNSRPATPSTESADVEMVQLPVRCSTSKERVPSVIPWGIHKDLRECFNTFEQEPQFTRPTNMLRRIRTNYNAALNDIRNIKRYAAVMAAAKPPAATNLCSAARDKTIGGLGAGGRLAERKLLNTTSPQRKLECGKLAPGLSVPPPRRVASRHTLERKTSGARSVSSSHGSELELKRAQPLVVTSRQSLKATPLNVNINVYADKLKLLRV